MNQATLYEAKDVTGIGAATAAAWRRLWRRREDGRDDAPFWTSGVTYRGYLGANGGASGARGSDSGTRHRRSLHVDDDASDLSRTDLRRRRRGHQHRQRQNPQRERLQRTGCQSR